MIKVGTDIIEVKRIQDSITKYGDKFTNKIFTQKELDYCNRFKFAGERFAGKFAAKESVQKALMSVMPEILFPLHQIEIQNDQYGRPIVILLGELEKYNHIYSLETSVSHIKEIATATTILVEK